MKKEKKNKIKYEKPKLKVYVLSSLAPVLSCNPDCPGNVGYATICVVAS